MAAGHVLLIGLILLMVGWLLNAQGMQKTAQGQSLGWRRDVAVFFADPVASISHFLHTDRPRQWLKDGARAGRRRRHRTPRSRARRRSSRSRAA